jgi:DNA-binding NtrC family response regulator
MVRVLFVDDDSRLLSGLEDALRPMRRSLAMRFAVGPQAALRALDAEPADVVVTDLRMPWMNGLVLLRLIEAWHPGARRIVLSGQTGGEWRERVQAAAHLVLTKPCPTAQLVEAIVGESRATASG